MDAAHGEKLQVRCRFCETYGTIRKLNRDTEKAHAETGSDFEIDHQYKARLLVRTVRIWKDGRTPRKNHAGDYTTDAFRLRFCPECGRRIQGKGRR